MEWLIYAAFAIAVFYALGIYTRAWCQWARRSELRSLHAELGNLTWMGADAGWDVAIASVRKHIQSKVEK